MRSSTVWCGLGALLAAALAAPAEGAAISGDVAVTLQGALVREGPDGKPMACDLRLDFVCREGAWDENVWGYAHDYNRADHEGTVRATTAGAKVRLEARMEISPDAWIAGGRAAYTIDLDAKDGALEGTFAGTFKGRPISGRAVGRVGPPWPAPVAGHKPFAPGEHPRLIFRKADIPALKERMRTPEGRRLIDQLRADLELDRNGFGYGWVRRPPTQAHEGSHGNWAAAHGFLWVLTGDRAHLARAGELVGQAMKAVTAQDETWIYTWMASGTALAYDLCADAWDEPLRRQVANFLNRTAWTWTCEPRDWRPQDTTPAIRDLSPYGPELVMFRAAAAACALAVMGDPVDYPRADPAAPARVPSHEPRWVPFQGLLLDEPSRYPNPNVSRAEAAADLEPGRGVPRVKFESDRPITEWLVASVPEDPAWRPFREESEKDPLQSIGGSARAQPEVGTKIAYLGAEAEFQPLEPERVFRSPYTDYRPSVRLLRDAHYEKQTLDSYYTVIENDRPRYVRLYLGQRYLWWPKIWVGGTIVREREVFHLPAGRVPLVIQVRIPTQQTYAPYHPPLYGLTDKSGKTIRTRGRRGNWHYNWTVLHETAMRYLPAEDEDMWMTPRLVEVDDPRPHWEAGLEAWKDAGGASPTAERSYRVALRTVRRYLERYLGERGWITGNGDHDEVNEYLYELAYLCRTARGEELAAGPGEGIGWTALLAMMDGMSRWRNDRGSGLAWLPMGLSSVPERYRPAVAWYLEQGPLPKKIPHIHIFHMVNQPWALRPEPPAALLPLALEDAKLGGWLLRSGWEKDDCFAIFESGRIPKRNCGMAGEFAVHGFGAAWVERSVYGGGTCYFWPVGQTNSVAIEGTYPAGGGEVVHSALRPDGSGTISIDMSAIFWGGEPRRAGLVGAAAGATGWGIHWGDPAAPAGPKDVGIRAVRSFAADYSGRSGAKALYAVADRFSGADGRTKTWRARIGAKAVLSETEEVQATDERGRKATSRVAKTAAVLLGAGGDSRATMQMTFAAPADCRPALLMEKDALAAVRATTGGDGFLVVITLQEGEPPPVKVEGEGLGAKVTIGSRVVRFDGTKVMLEE